jgi:hypothetical protein
LDDAMLRQGLEQLVAAEFLYEEGTPPQSTYRFKHALVHVLRLTSPQRSG